MMMNTRVVLNKSQYSNPQPEVQIVFPVDIHYRERRAEIYKLAVKIELASKDDGWIVIPEVYENKIRLELISCSNEEIDRGIRVLEDVLGLEHS
jgi:hypothetical protein